METQPTPLEWDDLVLDAATTRQVEMIARWVRHSKTLLEDWKLGRWLKPGYRALFMGPPGTGKTMAALLIGKALGLPVYRMDVTRLSEPLPERAGILLIEVDLLLAGDDRSANQQVTYLLQRLEDNPGLVIVTTNLHDRIDESFRRRFESVIHFAMPDTAGRLRLWQQHFANDAFKLGVDVDLAALASTYELSGGSIANILRHAALMAVEHGEPVVHAADLREGIRLELAKGT